MITGRVTEEREIVIPIECHSDDDRRIAVDAILDTGFNGFLTLPPDTIQTLDAVPAGTRRANLADGTSTDMDVFVVTINWLDEQRDVLALQAEAAPLAGMSLLWGNQVRFDAKVDGHVSIDEIP